MVRKMVTHWMVWLLVLGLAAPMALPAQDTSGGRRGTTAIPARAVGPDAGAHRPLPGFPPGAGLRGVNVPAGSGPGGAVHEGERLPEGRGPHDGGQGQGLGPQRESHAGVSGRPRHENEKLDWTQNLGDAFLNQQRDLMDSVQRLRAKAQNSGNLKSSKEVVSSRSRAPSTS